MSEEKTVVEEKVEVVEKEVVPMQKAPAAAAPKPVESEKKIYIDFGETKQAEYPKPPLIPDDSYNATFVGADMGEFDNFEKSGKITKFVFQLHLDGFVHEGKEVTLPFFVKAVVTKSYKAGISNSSLYDLIEAAGLMDGFHKNYVQFEELAAFKAFIEGNLIGRSCRVQVSTVNKKNPGKEQYSKVEKVLRFEPLKGEN